MATLKHSVLTALTIVAAAGAARAQILTQHSPSLTTYLPSGASAVQDIRPMAVARGVGIDGSMRAPSVQGWALAGNPFGDAAPSGAKIGDVNLATGAYMTTAVDLALPQPGMAAWRIGRSFNGRQETSGSAHRDSNGYQGYNWFQMSQPSLVYYSDSGDHANDVIYIMYGADRYLEFKRRTSTSSEYVARNGAAGVIWLQDGDTEITEETIQFYVYYDQHGVKTYFFGGANTGSAAWQIWKIEDSAGNVSYVGSSSNISTAMSAYTADGGIQTAFDAAGRRYCYTYSGSTIGGVKRLTQVLVETQDGESWGACGEDTMVAKVEYTYYETTETDMGKAGDLKVVTVTTPMTDAGIEQVQRWYYRYCANGGWYNADMKRGEDHQIRMVVGPEGCRNRDYSADSTFEYGTPDPEFYSDSDATLKPYSQVFIEYADTSGSSPYRVSLVTPNGQCGCGSASNNGTHEITYSDNGSFSGISGYDDEWLNRAIVEQPNGTYATQYFDECGQPISRVMTDADPSGSPTKTWATEVVRDSTSGCVTEIHTPANITAYTHSTGAFTRDNGVGLVNIFGRVSGGTMDSFPESVKYKEGNTGTAYFMSWTDYTSRGLAVGSATDYRPMVSERRAYHTATSTYSTGGTYDATTMSYAWWSGTSTNVLYVALKQATTTNPIVTTANNGSNSATTMDRFVRQDGTTAFSLAPDGIYTYTQYTNGQLTKRINDVITNGTFTSGDDPNTDWGITETGNGSDRTTLYSYDAQGRMDTMTDPDGAAKDQVHKNYYSVLLDGRLATISWPILDTTSTPTYFGPATYTVSNQAGKPEFGGMIAISSSGSTAGLTSWIDETDTDPILALTTGTLARMSTSLYDESGTQLLTARAYHTIPGSGVGSSGTNYDATTFAYDTMGRRIRTVDPTGTITRTSFDALGRTYQTHLGTDDTGLEGSTLSGTSNMVKTSENEYDGGSGGGNSHLTKSTRFVENSTTDKRETSYAYDFRGRLLMTTNPIAPHSLNKYDNLGRMTATAQYSASVSSSTDPAATGTQTYRVALSKSFYDELGRVYKTERWKIDQSDGSDDDSLTSNTWRDAAGRVIKVKGSTFEKSVYDRLGRMTKRFIMAKDNDSSYGDAFGASGDHVLEEHQTVYESTDSDDVLMTVAIAKRYTSGSASGPLDSNADNDDLLVTAANLSGRAQITAMWYDDLHRLTDTVNYGTYGGSNFDRDGLSCPTRSDTALRTTTTYNDDGTVLQVEAPGLPSDPTGLYGGATAGTKTRYTYDKLGRKTAVINNYTGASPPLTTETRANDLYTRYAYSNGLMTHVWVDMRGEDTVPPIGGDKDATPTDDNDQVTTYIYGTTTGTPSAMKVTTGNLLRAVKYPDSANTGTTQAYIDGTSDADVVTYAYNALGQQTSKKDQAGTTIETVYDNLGRETDRKATALGSGIDNAVLRITTAYLSRGLPDTVTQYDATSSGNVTDQVQYSYDDWGNLTQFNQDVDSAIGGSGRAAFNVGYTYSKATGGRQTLRRATMTGTSMNTVTYTYSSFAVDDAASMVTYLTTSSVNVAQYDYLGTRQVFTQLGQIYVDNLVTDFSHWDRFNRPIGDVWYGGTPGVFIHSLSMTYDRNGGIVTVADANMTDSSGYANYDVRYTNDDLGRLVRAEEGELTGIAITTTARDERWMDGSGNSSLTQTGNWERFRRDLDGDGNFTGTNELDDTRTHSISNELETRDTDTSGGADVTLTYDAAGNMTGDTWGPGYTYVYDAFGRFRKVTKGAYIFAEYRYNGLGMKIAHHYDSTRSGGGAPDGTVDGDDPWYYTCHSEKGQPITIFRNSDTDAKERYIYHTAGLDGTGSGSYIDDVVLCDADKNTGWTSAADSTKEYRYYMLQNWRHDVIMNLTSGGALLEEVKYDSYGVPKGLPAGDRFGDGTYDSTDESAISSYSGSYKLRYDTNLDGSNDASDATGAKAITGTNQTLGFKVLSSTAVFNRCGYAGYEHAFELEGNKYHVRNRVLDGELGRWTRRDPLGYVDGMGLYEYVASKALIANDASGLRSRACTHDNGQAPPAGAPPADVVCSVLCATPLVHGVTGCKMHLCCVCDARITSDYPLGYPIISDCIDEQEAANLQNCTNNPTLSEHCRECYGYSVGLACLQRRLSECTTSDCILDILKAIQEFAVGYVYECNACAGGGTARQ